MSRFSLSFDQAKEVADTFGTPLYLYRESDLVAQADAALSFPAPFGLTVRYAMKAAPNAAILQLFHQKNLNFDASSGYEVHRLLKAGIPASAISLSSQELSDDFELLIEKGISFNACSINQLKRYATSFSGTKVGLRFNPGLGSGGTNRTNVGGVASSFGIWNGYADQVESILKEYNLEAFRIHSHIGSGSDPEVWKRAATLTLGLVERFQSVTHMNLGGGFKVARVDSEKGTDLQVVGQPVKNLLEDFATRSGRKIHLEIEPGTFLVANAAAILSTVTDIVDTGTEGYRFVKLDTGMTDILRPSLYGSQHPISFIQKNPSSKRNDYMIVGHCCESGDILTPAPSDSEALQARKLPEPAVGDFVLIGGAGAYCSSMSAKNYNSFPESVEVMLRQDGRFQCIRKRQTLDQILANETPLQS